MPELKHGFGAAKMNKDLDERIVPNGEYRDALNIEVSTSEGSDVGTMQTILGNTAITETGLQGMKPGLFSPSSRCVGSIADEQNNHIYYFVADPANHTDYIIRYDSDADILTPIIVDKYQVEKEVSFDTDSSNTDPKAFFTIEMDGLQTNRNTSNVRPGMVISTNSFVLAPNTPLAITFDQFYTVIKMEREINWQGSGTNHWIIHLDVIEPHYDASSGGSNASDLYEFGIKSYEGDVVKFAAERVLNFSVNASPLGSSTSSDYFPPITGINIIDGILIWTDGRTEPKKIIVEDYIKDVRVGRSGTYYNGEYHSFFNVYSPNQIGVTQAGFPPTDPNSHGLIVKDSDSLTMQPDFIKEQHITVIKKSPLYPPTIEMSNTSDGRFAKDALNQYTGNQANIISSTDSNAVFVDSDGNNLPIDSVVNIKFTTAVDYLVGDLLLLRSNTNYSPFDPNDIGDYELIVEIVEFNSSNNETKVKIVWIQTNFVNSSTVGPAPNLTITVTPDKFHSILKQEKPLYEFKFPRFAFRYKYVDNQYSPYSPFSEPAFLPGLFSYVPKEGYNLGMVNTLRSIYITDFVTDSDGIPKDVIEIDILYKESNSTNIYKVKTVKYREEEWTGYGSDIVHGIGVGTSGYAHTTGRIQITSEMVRSAVASNQLLRPWDNVPRAAKAQEIVGNRIVYANYLQNYNL
jgi:hypothetical protein